MIDIEIWGMYSHKSLLLNCLWRRMKNELSGYELLVQVSSKATLGGAGVIRCLVGVMKKRERLEQKKSLWSLGRYSFYFYTYWFFHNGIYFDFVPQGGTTLKGKSHAWSASLNTRPAKEKEKELREQQQQQQQHMSRISQHVKWPGDKL